AKTIEDLRVEVAELRGEAEGDACRGREQIVVEAGSMTHELGRPEHRNLLNRCVARARAFERRQLTKRAEQLRADIAAERDAMLGELAKLKANMLGEFFAIRDELEATRAELEKLRALHKQAREQREAIRRDRMWADAMLAQRDPMMPLQ